MTHLTTHDTFGCVCLAHAAILTACDAWPTLLGHPAEQCPTAELARAVVLRRDTLVAI